MSQENVEIVRRAYELFNDGGVQACIEGGVLSPEIVIDASPARFPGIGAYHGHDGALKLFDDDWFAAFPLEEWEHEGEEVLDGGAQVVVVTTQRGRGAESGASVELRTAQVVLLRESVIVRFDIYRERSQVLEAAGLSE
jgi:ketosteroid isomerase-like protein